MNNEPLYKIRQVCRRYDDTLAVDVADLEIATGEVFCLLGPTGAGKSTLLRMLCALENPDDGEIRLMGDSIDADNLPLATQRKMTLVFQRPLMLTGTVRSNVEYGLRLRHAKQQVLEKVDRMLDRLGLSARAHQSAHTLSGGQTQLVALARALVFEPDVLLLDEPTANLDPAHVALVEEVIAEVRRRRGTTIVWATHNLFQARRVAQRVGLLLNGRLIEVAEKKQFFDSPRDPRTADFVQGKMIY